MDMMETQKEPQESSLYRVVNDIGRAFGVGVVGGSVFHFIVGAYNSPLGSRFVGGTQAVTMNAPRLGGTFATYSGLFSTFRFTMVYVRKKEDPWNSIVAGAATGGFLSVRRGIVAASTSAVLGGLVFATLSHI